MDAYRLDVRRYSLPFRTPLRTAHGLCAERAGWLLRLTDDRGGEGFGEVAPLEWFGTESLAECEDLLARLGDAPSAESLAAVPAHAGCVRSGLAMALAGLAGGPAGGPEALPVAALLPAGRAALEVVEARLELGFRVFKWKVGVGAVADEWGMLDDLLGRLPAGARLRLDANGAWDRRMAERWLERCADRPIEHVEQPVAAQARSAQDLLMGLAGDYPTPVALDESLVHQADVDRWLQAGWPGVYVLKLSLLSDVRGTLDALRRAEARVVFSSALETGVGAQAALRHAFAWTGAVRALGFGLYPLFSDSRFDGPFAAPFLRRGDLERIDPRTLWNALN